MTWNGLKDLIESMEEEQRNTDVMVYTLDILSKDEFFGVAALECTGDYDDILDRNHPYLAVDS
jgi:hypothetical protein